jgi:hypothetical protein
MASEQYLPSDVITLAASGDHSSNQFKFVYIDTNGRAALMTSATAHPIGVLVNDPGAIDTDAEVMTALGKVVKVVANGNSVNIAIGDKIGTDATGNAVKKTANDYHGIAREAATADGVVIGMLYVGVREV